MDYRYPTSDELRLLRHLAAIAPEVAAGADWVTQIRVSSMLGGMGSLSFASAASGSSERRFHHFVSEVHFHDIDGVLVLASISVDELGDPFELDIWKVDSTDLIAIPDSLPPAFKPP